MSELAPRQTLASLGALIWRGSWPLFGGCPATGELHQMTKPSPDRYECADCPGWFDADELRAFAEAGNAARARYVLRQN